MWIIRNVGGIVVVAFGFGAAIAVVSFSFAAVLFVIAQIARWLPLLTDS